MANNNLAATCPPASTFSETTGHVNPTFRGVGDVMGELALVYRLENRRGDLQNRIHALALRLIAVVEQDPDAAIACLHLVRKGPYSVWHSVHAAILAEIVGRFLGWSQIERISVGCAALTMNIGMHDLQDELYRQKDALTDAQRFDIHRHPEMSAGILRAADVFDPIWLETVLNHHESPEGDGYPRALEGSAVSFYARVLHLADVYCAQMSSRLYRPSALSEGVMLKMFETRGSRLGRSLAHLFLKAVGAFPAGTGVELSNGDTAIVIRKGDAPRSAYHPIVRSVCSGDGTVYMDPPIRDTELPQFSVEAVREAPPKRLPYALETLWAGN